MLIRCRCETIQIMPSSSLGINKMFLLMSQDQDSIFTLKSHHFHNSDQSGLVQWCTLFWNLFWNLFLEPSLEPLTATFCWSLVFDFCVEPFFCSLVLRPSSSTLTGTCDWNLQLQPLPPNLEFSVKSRRGARNHPHNARRFSCWGESECPLRNRIYLQRQSTPERWHLASQAAR